MRTIDEVIKDCNEKAEEMKANAEQLALNGFQLLPKEEVIKAGAWCLQCSAEHEQLAEWLEELKARREADKQGEWKLVSMGLMYKYQCSVCGRTITTTPMFLADYPFCHCGAKMKFNEVTKNE